MSLLSELLNKFKETFDTAPDVVASSPGRLDFLNTHQDYKGLPVVSVGVNLRTYIAIKIVNGDEVSIVSYNLKEEGSPYQDIFRLSDLKLREGKWFGNYLRAGLIAYREKGIKLPGMYVGILSSVPVGGGLASSAALLVSFLGAVAYALNLSVSRKEIAELAYHAEHDIMGIPCGRLDQYGSAYGKVIRIETRPPYNVEEINFREGVFVVLDSGIKHSTADIHPRRQAEIDEGLRILMRMPEIPLSLKEKLGEHYYEPRWEEITMNEITPFLAKIPKVSAKRIEFTLRMNSSTELALKIMRGLEVSPSEIKNVLPSHFHKEVDIAFKERGKEKILRLIGIIMNYQHELLRDLYDLSLPELEAIRDSALSSGAYGVKLSGAGLGGSLIALTHNRKTAEEVLRRGLSAGAKRGWIVEIDDGLRREL